MQPFEAMQLMTDEYAVKILVGTMRKPRTAIDLSELFGIPIAACYRKIRLLEEMGLITCIERKLTREGKRISVYQSQLKNAYMSFEDGRMRVRFELANGVVQDSGDQSLITTISV